MSGTVAPFSVIIPAHNEASVIRRCLESLLEDPGPDGPPEILVMCNGCRDDTAQIARAVSPLVRVIELDQGSKVLAINAGNAAARATPRFFVDADVVVTGRSLAATAEVLRADGPVHAAAPALKVDLAGCSWPIRSYYRVWLHQPYVHNGMVGSGVYGLSATGLARVGEIPPIIADDAFVRTRFADGERLRVEAGSDGRPASFTVFPPRDLGSLLRIEARRRAGDLQLGQGHDTAHNRRTTTGGSLLASLGKGVGPIDLAVYLAIKLASRAMAARLVKRRAPIAWARDESSR